MQQKQYETLKQSSREVQQFAVKHDWMHLIGSLETFYKLFLKNGELSVRSGAGSKLFVRTLVLLSTELSSFSQEPDFKKQMSTLQAKAFNSLNQRVKKYMRGIEPSDIAIAELSLKRGADSETDSAGEAAEADTNDRASLDPESKAVVDIMSVPKEDVTFEMIDSKLKDIATSRGKKGVDRVRVVQQLQYIATLSKCPAQEVEIFLHIVSAQFDLSGSMSAYMATPVWRRCLSNILSIIQLLQSNTHISLIDEAELDTRPTNDEIMSGAAVQLRGSLRAFAERLDDEYTKSLQCLDAHTKEYVGRLQDEGALLILLHEVGKFYEKTNSHIVTSLSLRLLERIYCKSCSTYEALRRYVDFRIQNASAADSHQITAENVDSDVLETDIYATTFRLPSCELSALVEALSTYIYKYGDERAKARTLLCQIFNEALHGNLKTAKELLLMSHLQENIQLMDVSTQILFNRAVAQLGICAFELGHFDEAFTFLSDLFAGGRTKELLAQGLTQSRFNDRSAEQEKIDRRRQLPHHLHINLDLLESIFLVCTMLLEVSELLNSKKATSHSRYFLRIVDYYNRQLFMGPADNARDTILAATKLLLVGDYERASQLLLDLPAWGALAESRSRVLEILDERLKAEAIRVFLQQFAEQYASVSVSVLAEMVSLTETKVGSAVSSTIASEDVSAVFDDAARSLQLSHYQHTKLQSAASTFVEKVLILLDANERALDRHVGTENTVHDDEEPARTRRQERSSAEPDEYHSRRSRSEQHRGKFLAVDVVDSTTKVKNRDSYGHFSRRKTSREIFAKN